MQRQERQYCFCYHFLRPIYDCILSVCGCFLFQHKLPSPFIASFDGNIFTSLSLLRFSPIVSVTRFDEILPALAKIPKVFCTIWRVNLLLGKILSLLWQKIMLLLLRFCQLYRSGLDLSFFHLINLNICAGIQLQTLSRFYKVL